MKEGTLILDTLEARTERALPVGRLRAGAALDLAVVAMEIAGAVLSARRNGTGMFRFYTEDSNLLALCACALCAFFTLRALRQGRPLPEWVRTVKYMAAACLTVTFLVVVCVLAPMMGAAGYHGYQMMLLSNSMLFHHLLCPIVLFISFVFFMPGPALTRAQTLWAWVPTLVYAAVSITLNIANVMQGPYPFLLVHEQPVWASVLWCSAIIGGAYVLILLLRRLHRLAQPRSTAGAAA